MDGITGSLSLRPILPILLIHVNDGAEINHAGGAPPRTSDIQGRRDQARFECPALWMT